MITDLIQGYKTSHLPLAAFLSINGGVITKIDAVGNRGVFIFAFVHRDLINDFNNGTAKVEPGAYALKMSQLNQTAKRIIQETRI